MAHEITRILQDWKNGDDSAVERLFPLVYEDLKRQAKYYLNGERADHLLQPTALVHEVYLRLINVNQLEWQDRAHFFAVSSMFMRRILVDHARELAADKRGGARQRVTLDNIQIAAKEKAFELLLLDEALDRLEKIEKRKARVVELKFFGGLNQSEIAELLNVGERTVQRDWQFAKLWLFREMSQRNRK